MGIIFSGFSFLRRGILSYSKQFIVCLVIGILLAVVFYEIDISFLQRKLEKNQKQIITIKELIRNKKQILVEDRLKQEKLKLSQPVFVKQITPASGLEIINILHVLEQLIFDAKIANYLFEPGSIQDNEWFNIYPIKMSFKGEYRTIFMLFNRILQLPLLIGIEELELQLSQKQGMIIDTESLQMTIGLMVYKSKYSGVETVIKNPGTRDLFFDITAKNIFKQPEAERDLSIWSNKELRFLGVIKEGKITFGIVSDPMGVVYRVKIGDKIGLNQNKITVIDGRGIVTADPADNIYSS